MNAKLISLSIAAALFFSTSAFAAQPNVPSKHFTVAL